MQKESAPSSRANQRKKPASEESSEKAEQEDKCNIANDSSSDSDQIEDGHRGIHKLFDLMKMDLGQKQSDEMKNFYEKMSTQIKELCTATDDDEKGLESKQHTILGAQIPKVSTVPRDQADGKVPENQSQLNQFFLLSLLQYQRQKILQESAGKFGASIKDSAEKVENEAASGGDSSDLEAVYDERVGEPCLVDESRTEGADKEGKILERMRIKCMLKPLAETTSQHLLKKSDNNINPNVIVETEARTSITTLIDLMATKLFMEDRTKFCLRVHKSKFSYQRCKEKSTRVQDLLLAEDPGRLEATLAGNKEIKLCIKYEIRERGDSEEKVSETLSENPDEEIQIPDDLSESELMEMFTEVMSIMLFNKDEQLNRYVGTVAEFDLKSKLPHPSEILGKRKKRKRQTSADQLAKSPLDNEKSEVSQTSQQRRREAKRLSKKQSQCGKPLAERMADYQKSQLEKQQRARQKREQKVQKLVLNKRRQMQERIESWNSGRDPPQRHHGGEDSESNGFQSVEQMINFRTNPYFDNLVRLGKQQQQQQP